MALQELPRVTQLDLAFVELPDTHPAADLARTIPVHGSVLPTAAAAQSGMVMPSSAALASTASGKMFFTRYRSWMMR